MRASDERREVAATMRIISSEGVKDLTLGEVLNSILTGGAPRPTTETAILARLADLIDPTCEVRDDNSLTSDFAYVCRACGEHFSTCDKPNYCPGCGARVVTDHGRD